MAINVRNKGQSGEREVIKILQPIINQVYDEHLMIAPQLQRNTLQSDKGGYDIVGLDGFAFEVKRCERLELDKWWNQAVRQAGNDKEPVLFYRQNRGKWRVRMLQDVITLQNNCVTMLIDVSIDDFKIWFKQIVNLNVMLRK